jgi:hypothetical protein
VLPRTGCKPRRFASNPTSSGRDAVILASFACDAGKPRVRLRNAEAARIERPAEPVEQLAPGTRHPAGERTLQMRVAWRAATIFRRAGAPACDAARISDARGWLHFCLDPDRMGFVRKGRPASGCGRNYTILMEVGLPKLFHRFTRLAMITPSRCCDSGLRVSRREPIHRLLREICASTRERNP